MNYLPSRKLFLALAFGLAVIFSAKFLVPRTMAQAQINTSEIDRFVSEQMAENNLPGLALAITRGNEIVHLRGYGNASAGQPMTPQTQLLIASLSKSFTALAILQLVEAGTIDLDAPVQHYLPEFTLADPAQASRITIRHLLNQTGGLADAGYPEGRLPQPTTFEELISSLSRARPIAPPGTAFHYFNPNYQVLARVVEVVSGEPFSIYLQTHVFAPLQMDNTFSAVTSNEALQRADSLADGHIIVYALPVTLEEMSGFLGGSGGVVSTAEDMANYLIMQNSNGRFADASLLSPKSMALMHTPPQNVDSNYAMGWIETETNGTKILDHNGILSVYYADIALLPETGHGIVLLYNFNSLAATTFATPRIKRGLISLLTGGVPASGGFDMRMWGAAIGLATLVGAMLAIRSLLRLPSRRQKAARLPTWRLLLGILGTFTPAILLLGLPSLITSTSGRAFSYAQLLRSMPDLFVWLGIGTVLGLVNGTLRIVHLLRARQ